MRIDLSPLTAAYQRLSSRERSLLGGALAVIIVVGFYMVVWQPLEDSQIALAKRIQLKQHELVEMQQMREDYLDLLNQFELRQKIIDKADPKFSLFPHIESTVSQVLGGREKIASMNPQNKELSGAYREESVELKLNAVSLQQLVDLMYHIEKGAQPLRLTRLQVKKRPREPQTFDVTATVAMLKSTDAGHAAERPAAERPAEGGVAEPGSPEAGAPDQAPGDGAPPPAAEVPPGAPDAPAVAPEPAAAGAEVPGVAPPAAGHPLRAPAPGVVPPAAGAPPASGASKLPNGSGARIAMPGTRGG